MLANLLAQYFYDGIHQEQYPKHDSSTFLFFGARTSSCGFGL